MGKHKRYGLHIPPANRGKLPPPEVELTLFDVTDNTVLVKVRGPVPAIGQGVQLQTAQSGPLECVVERVTKTAASGQHWSVGVRLARPAAVTRKQALEPWIPSALPPALALADAAAKEDAAQTPPPPGQMTPERLAALKAQLARLTPDVLAAIGGKGE